MNDKNEDRINKSDNVYSDIDYFKKINNHKTSFFQLLKPNFIFVRKEILENEFRTPIVPQDVPFYILNDITVIVQRSPKRIFSDEEYEKHGAILIDEEWYELKCDEEDIVWIVGIKELNNPEKMLCNPGFYIHFYFAHCYKNQIGSGHLLNYFKKSNSVLYDFEYFVGKDNKRLIAFGHYAGFVGGALGMMQYAIQCSDSKESFSPIEKHWSSKKQLMKDCSNIFKKYKLNKPSPIEDNKIKIAVIGGGRCSQGVQNFLQLFDLEYDLFLKNSDKSDLNIYNIIYNCIHLKDKIPVWFDETTFFNQETVIVDISCDFNHPYHPIAIYKEKTTWNRPVYQYKQNVSIIAIDNLPSLLPSDSSTDFSGTFKLLVQKFLQGDEEYIWENNFKLFKSKIKNLFEENCSLEEENIFFY